MEETDGTRERGFTLIEIVIAVAIIAATVGAGVGLSLASRSFAVAAAATEFDHLLDSARTIAREVQGATLAFVPDAFGDGTEVRVFAGNATGTLTPTTLPVLHTRATIEELEALRKPPFAFIVHVNGALGGRPGFRAGDTASAAETSCPASGAFHFVIHAAGGSADRYVPCRVTVASTGPAALATWPAATPAANPTPCGGPCTTAPLPTAPSSSPTCPPNYTTTAGGCTPTPTPNPGPHYHVSATLASPTMTVGGTDSVTAQATLTNANEVPPGTPSTIPVAIQNTADAVCTASPLGSQPSGATFTLNGASSGNCTVTFLGDASGVFGASADTATITVSVVGLQTATPPPQPCDLVANGKCYRRLVDSTNQLFSKNIIPAVECTSGDVSSCTYIDAIQSIQLGPGYIVRPTTPPQDKDHELLFKIDKVVAVLEQCSPYTVFSGIPGGANILPGAIGTGAPVNSPIGFGQPSMYLTVNHVLPDAAAQVAFQAQAWSQATTMTDLYEAVAQRKISDPYTFTYSSPSVTSQDYIQWYPDFPACDVSGERTAGAVEYGTVSVSLVFEIYQAQP